MKVLLAALAISAIAETETCKAVGDTVVHETHGTGTIVELVELIIDAGNNPVVPRIEFDNGKTRTVINGSKLNCN